MSRMLILLALTVGGAVLLPPPLVSAHAEYERSEPSKNAILPEPPARVDVWFNFEVFKRQGANFVRVFDEQEVQVSEGDGIVDDDDRTHIFAELQPDLPAGRYIVRWMTTSDEDGEEDSGAFCFYAGVEPTAEQEAECAAFGDGEDEAIPATALATPTESAAVAAPTPSPDPSSDGAADAGDGGVPTAAVVGGVAIVAVVLVAAAGGVAAWLRRTLR